MGLMVSSRNYAGVSSVLFGIEGCLLTIPRRQVSPQLFGALTTTIPDMKGNDSTRLPVHGDPEPVGLGLLLHEAPQLDCLNR